VAEGSAAAQAGLKEGDVLLAVDGFSVADAVDIHLALDAREPGDRVRLRWRREGKEMEGEGTLAAPPSPFAPPPAPAPTPK
jgi:putative serine protease PepD